MLEEAVEVIRALWEGRLTSHDGVHYVVENARIYSLPETPPPIVVAAGGSKAATLAGGIGDGLMVTGPEEEPIEEFRQAGGTGKPVYGEVTVCWAESEQDAAKTVKECWPLPGIPGQLSQELALPAFFEQAAELIREEDLAETVPVGPDPERHLEAIRGYLQAGIDHVFVHQVGPDQDGFFRFYEQQVLPKVG